MEKRQNTYYFSCGKCFRKLDEKEFKKKHFAKRFSVMPPNKCSWNTKTFTAISKINWFKN